MIRFITVIIFLASCLQAISQNEENTISVIPEPVSIEAGTGHFTLTNTTQIEMPGSNPDIKRVADSLSKKIAFTSGHNIVVNVNKSSPGANNIQLVIINDPLIGKEGYTLKVTPRDIIISANTPAGIFYGVQTLYQLLPKEIEGKLVAEETSWIVPVCSITDYPRFGWRGLMFDVSRHFFTKNEVKQYIDEMVKFKFNLLHLHLTDDEGWRIEIKALPKLTTVGAWNAKRVGYFGTFSPPPANEPRTYGGFYTQDDIKELVQYAKEKFVNILPEIDVPGHSLAAVVSYPDLSCTKGAEKYQVRSGEEIMDWSHGHPPIALVDNTLCPANEKVYVFLDKVLTEVARLFPFEYIHMGGDECPKNFWQKSPAIAALMQKEKLKNMQEVQSYFEKRLEKMVESKGKKFMGWDEILEGGLAPGAAVMSWRGIKGGIEAAKMKHDVVMSPTTFAYIDYMQGDAITEPRVYETLRLQKAYQFEPVPDGADSQYIKGGQANLWTEQIYTLRHAEYMTWPRALAIAESVWSPKKLKNFDKFTIKVEQQFKRWDKSWTKYSPAMYDPIFTVSRDNAKQLKITLSTELKGLDIYYTFDNSFPDHFSPKYTRALMVPKEAVMLKLITYRDKYPVGRMIYMPIDELQKRANRK